MIFKTKVAFGLYFLFFIAAFFTNGVPFILSDGFGSFHTTNCLIEEGSFACSNEPYYFSEYTYHTVSDYKTGFVTVYAPGSAIVNLPLQFVANIIDNSSIENSVFVSTTGHTMLEGLGFLITASILSFLSLYLMYKSLRFLGFGEKLSIISTFSSFFASYAIWYVLLNSAFNHNLEIFALSLLLFGLTRRLKIDDSKNLFFIGLGLALATLARPPLALIFLPIFVYLIYDQKYKELFNIILIGVPFALIWFIYNQVSYDNFLASGYGVLFNQNFEFNEWNGLNILLSKFRGWFVYSPLFLLSTFALFKFLFERKHNKYKRFLYFLSLYAIFSTVLIYGFWPIWWSGGSFGQRFLISILPFANIGTALFLNYTLSLRKELKLVAKVVFVIFLIWTMSLTLLYRFTPVETLRPVEDSVGEMRSGDRYTPIDMYDYHADLISNSESIPDYASSILESYSGGPSMVLFWLGLNNSTLRIESGLSENSINFYYLEQQVPTENLQIYVDDKELDRIYSIELTPEEYKKDFEIICQEVCKINTLELTEIEEEIMIDSVLFTKFDITSRFTIYINDVENLSVRGAFTRQEVGAGIVLN